jgi:hypothetical protein
VSELSHLTELLGECATIALIEAHGGTRLSVPRSADGDAALRTALGDAAFLKLVQYFGGSVLAVPLARAWRAKIYRSRDGLTYAQIARRCGVTESAVFRMLSGAPNPAGRGRALGRASAMPGQLDFFTDI